MGFVTNTIANIREASGGIVFLLGIICVYYFTLIKK